jgi:hypothetical protein
MASGSFVLSMTLPAVSDQRRLQSVQPIRQPET